MKRIARRLLTEISFQTAFAILLFVVSVIVFTVITRETIYEHEDVFDQQVISFFSLHRTPGLIRIMEWITVFGSINFLVPAYILIAIYLVRKRQRFTAISIIILAVTSTLTMFWLKVYFHRERPNLPIIKGITNFSFPSGHSLSSFIFCSVLIYLVWRGNLRKIWKVVLIALLLGLALITGISRIVLNVHYATDVIGGFSLGIIWVLVSFYSFRKIHRRVARSNRQHDDTIEDRGSISYNQRDPTASR
jgi:membrane-associated phospholipid phosphatase